nr:LuxR C-terminal-related transcriptional regulator [Spinactinospora alkalitolerans]
MVHAVRQVAAGGPIPSPRITRRLMDRAAAQAGAYQRAREALAAPSPRENEVVLAVAGDRANAEIAAEPFMNVATVKARVSSILTKLALDNRTRIALLAHDAGLAP